MEEKGFFRLFVMEFLMVYYFLVFSIFSGIFLLLRVDNFENIMEFFSVCLWCMVEKFGILNENRFFCRVGIIVRR